MSEFSLPALQLASIITSDRQPSLQVSGFLYFAICSTSIIRPLELLTFLALDMGLDWLQETKSYQT